MLKKILLVLILSIFVIGFTTNSIASNNLYPDTSNIKESKLNVADLNDMTKYETFTVVLLNEGLISTYHISKEDIFPKYVSVLWQGNIAIGFCYYDNNSFYIWLREASKDSEFERKGTTIDIQESFKQDFEKIWSGVNFPITVSS